MPSLCVFTNIYSLPIDKDGRACRNILIQFPCVFVCLSLGDLLNFWIEFSLSFPLFCDKQHQVLITVKETQNSAKWQFVKINQQSE